MVQRKNRNFNNIVLFLIILFTIPACITKNMGHRLGGDIFQPENSLASYKKIYSQYKDSGRFEFSAWRIIYYTFKYVEFDLQETYDKQYVVFHDCTKNRDISRIILSSDNGYRRYNVRALKNIFEKKSFIKRFRDREEIPYFDSEGELVNKLYLHHLTEYEIKQLHLKGGNKIPTLKEVLDMSVAFKRKYNSGKTIFVDLKYITDRGLKKLLSILTYYREVFKLDIHLLVVPGKFRRLNREYTWCDIISTSDIILMQAYRKKDPAVNNVCRWGLR